MDVVSLKTPEPIAAGFYTVGEVARILGIENEAKVRRWLVDSSTAPAVIHRQYDTNFTNQELGFYDLMEIRFVE